MKLSDEMRGRELDASGSEKSGTAVLKTKNKTVMNIRFP